MATGELPVQCSDPYPYICGELVTGKLTPSTPADYTNNERNHVQEETDQSGPSVLVLPHPLYTYSGNRPTNQITAC